MHTTTETMTAPATCALVITEPTVYTDATLATASWWDRYRLLPGVYPFEWTTISGQPWNADPDKPTSGFVRNIGPYYALVTVRAHLIEQYREARVLSEVRANLRKFPDPQETTVSRAVYAYQLPGCPKGQHGRVLTEFMGGRVMPLDEVERYQRDLRCDCGMAAGYHAGDCAIHTRW